MNPALADVEPVAVTEAVQVVTMINKPADDNGVSTSGVAIVDAPAIADFDWQIPVWLPPPPVPADNPMSESKVSLGRHMFFFETEAVGSSRQN